MHQTHQWIVFPAGYRASVVLNGHHFCSRTMPAFGKETSCTCADRVPQARGRLEAGAARQRAAPRHVRQERQHVARVCHTDKDCFAVCRDQELCRQQLRRC